MAQEHTATRLQIHLSEQREERARLLVDRARSQDMAGATVWRAQAGVRAPAGSAAAARSPQVPVVVELVDEPDRIARFVAHVAQVAPGATTTVEQVRVRRFGVPQRRALEDRRRASQAPGS